MSTGWVSPSWKGALLSCADRLAGRRKVKGLSGVSLREVDPNMWLFSPLWLALRLSLPLLQQNCSLLVCASSIWISGLALLLKSLHPEVAEARLVSKKCDFNLQDVSKHVLKMCRSLELGHLK